MSQAHFVFASPQPWNQPFTQEALVPFNEGWYSETKVLHMFIAIGIAQLQGPLRKLGHIFIQFNIHLPVYFYMYLSIVMKEFILIFLIKPFLKILILLSVHVCKFLLGQ